VTNSPTEVQFILLEFHSSATTEPQSTTSEIALNLVTDNGNTGREAFDDGNQFRTV
jgi:hypothetical protein